LWSTMTLGHGLMGATKGFPEHDWLGNTGGSIGIAWPLAVGAAVAFPDRRVLCLTADGSAMYILQALWTMEREPQRHDGGLRQPRIRRLKARVVRRVPLWLVDADLSTRCGGHRGSTARSQNSESIATHGYLIRILCARCSFATSNSNCSILPICASTRWLNADAPIFSNSL
jgi:Thiamine pyrophosphate enzyme, C-terminal TPP binding domain